MIQAVSRHAQVVKAPMLPELVGRFDPTASPRPVLFLDFSAPPEDLVWVLGTTLRELVAAGGEGPGGDLARVLRLVS